jgi:hypothetical protein
MVRGYMFTYHEQVNIWFVAMDITATCPAAKDQGTAN